MESRNRDTDMWISRGKVVGGGNELRGWDWHVYITDAMYEMGN